MLSIGALSAFISVSSSVFAQEGLRPEIDESLVTGDISTGLSAEGRVGGAILGRLYAPAGPIGRAYGRWQGEQHTVREQYEANPSRLPLHERMRARQLNDRLFLDRWKQEHPNLNSNLAEAALLKKLEELESQHNRRATGGAGISDIYLLQEISRLEMAGISELEQAGCTTAASAAGGINSTFEERMQELNTTCDSAAMPSDCANLSEEQIEQIIASSDYSQRIEYAREAIRSVEEEHLIRRPQCERVAGCDVDGMDWYLNEHRRGVEELIQGYRADALEGFCGAR